MQAPLREDRHLIPRPRVQIMILPYAGMKLKLDLERRLRWEAYSSCTSMQSCIAGSVPTRVHRSCRVSRYHEPGLSPYPVVTVTLQRRVKKISSPTDEHATPRTTKHVGQEQIQRSTSLPWHSLQDLDQLAQCRHAKILPYNPTGRQTGLPRCILTPATKARLV